MTSNALSGPRVLLIGQRTNWGASLIATLEESGCTVSFARVLEEISRPIEREEFDLILVGSDCRHEMHLVPALRGSHTSVFYVCPVEDSCWWVPALRFGEICYGSSAMRPGEFAARLKEILRSRNGEKMKAAS